MNYRFKSLTAALALFGCACPSSNADEPAHPMTDAGAIPATDAKVSGNVERTVEPSESGDAVGTVYIAALESCDLKAPVAGFAVLQKVDLSELAGRAPFEITLPKARLSLAVFLDDNADADMAQPRPGPGDLVHGSVASDGMLDCVAVDSSRGDVDDVLITLGLRVPG